MSTESMFLLALIVYFVSVFSFTEVRGLANCILYKLMPLSGSLISTIYLLINIGYIINV